MNRDLDRLYDMLDSIENIQKYTENRELNQLNELEQAGIVHFLQIIGEASRALTTEFREKYNDINWVEIIAFRNILVHQYSNVDMDIVSRIIERDIPYFKEKVQSLIKKIEV